MNIDVLPALVLFAFVSSATPGPNNLMLMASGANFGFRRSLPHMVGISVGFMVMMMLLCRRKRLATPKKRLKDLAPHLTCIWLNS